MRSEAWIGRAVLVSLVCAAISIASAGCSARRDPVYIANDLPARGMRVIGLAPIVDARDDPFEDVHMLSYVRRTVESALREKGYGVVAAPVKAGGATEAAAAQKTLADMTDAEVARVSPPDVRWLMIVSLQRTARSAQEIGDMSKVMVSGRLVDVEDGHAVWRDTAEGEADIGGLLTVLTGPSTEYEGAYDAARLLVSTLPDGPDKGRRASFAVSPPGSHEESEPGPMRPAQPR